MSAIIATQTRLVFLPEDENYQKTLAESYKKEDAILSNFPIENYPSIQWRFAKVEWDQVNQAKEAIFTPQKILSREENLQAFKTLYDYAIPLFQSISFQFPGLSPLKSWDFIEKNFEHYRASPEFTEERDCLLQLCNGRLGMEIAKFAETHFGETLATMKDQIQENLKHPDRKVFVIADRKFEEPFSKEFGAQIGQLSPRSNSIN